MNQFFSLSTRLDRQLAFGATVMLLAIVAGIGMGVLAMSAPLQSETQAGLRLEATRLTTKPREIVTVLPNVKSITQPIKTAGPAKIVIVIDDLGMSSSAVDKLAALPPPLTLSFLPYAPNVQPLVDRSKAHGHEIMLHLPMEATRLEGSPMTNPGPNALLTGLSEDQLAARLTKNLDAFSGYVGVNNHMGSRFTRSAEKMAQVLVTLDRRGKFFMDSVTTGATKVGDVAAHRNIDILKRDVFLDADFGRGGVSYVQARLAELERIALRDGSAIAIGHPYPTTIEALGPWLVTAEARGFVVVSASNLLKAQSLPKPVAKMDLQVGE